MSQRAEIRAALLAQMLTVPGIPDADHRAIENTGFDGTPGEAWLDSLLSPGPQTLLTMPAQGGTLLKDGVWRVRLHYPIDSGPDVADAMADSVVLAFPAGQRLVSGATQVAIDSSRDWSGAPGIKDGFYTVPVDIRWHVFAINTLV